MGDPGDASHLSTTRTHYEVRRKDLPLHCPRPGADAHPRVYLPLGEKGRVRCPYCGTEYVLVER